MHLFIWRSKWEMQSSKQWKLVLICVVIPDCFLVQCPSKLQCLQAHHTTPRRVVKAKTTSPIQKSINPQTTKQLLIRPEQFANIRKRFRGWSDGISQINGHILDIRKENVSKIVGFSKVFSIILPKII